MPVRPRIRLPATELLRVGDAMIIGLIAGLFQAFPWIHDVGMVEEWGVYEYFDKAGVVPWAPSDPQLASQAIRPLTVLPHSIAYVISPDNFVALQAVQALGLGVKAGAMVLLLRGLGMQRAIALAGGLLYGLFPAHDASFTLRAVHMQWASAFFLVALWLFVVLIRRGFTKVTVTAMLVCQALSLLLYEASYGLVAAAPLLVLAYRSLPGRRRLLLTALWYVVPLINGIRIIVLLTSGKPLYQEATIIHAGRGSQELIDLVKFVWRGLASPLTSPHGHAVAILPVVAILLVAGMIVVGFRLRAEPDTDQPWRYRAMAIGGVLLAPMVVLVYLPNPGFLTDPLRVFAVAPVPLTIALCAGFAAIGRYWSYAGIVAAALLVPLTVTAAQAHRAYWHHRSDEQRQALGAIAAAVSHAPKSDHLLVIDENVLGDDVYALQGQLLVTALLYVRHAPDDVITHCGPLGSPAVAGVTSGCQQTASGFSVDGGPAVPYPVVVVLKSTGGTRIDPDMANLTPRERNLLPCLAKRSCGRTATLVPR